MTDRQARNLEIKRLTAAQKDEGLSTYAKERLTQLIKERNTDRRNNRAEVLLFELEEELGIERSFLSPDPAINKIHNMLHKILEVLKLTKG